MDAPNGIPAIGLGTWLRTGEDGFRAILTAIEVGYRHLDTAQTYGTEENVGRAIRESGLNREEFFVVTKVTNANLPRAKFMPSLRASAERMGIDRIDMTLIHWPSHRDTVPLAEYLEELDEARAAGLTRLIGVSNFTIGLIEKSVALLGKGALATNQFELHPYLQGRRLAAACARAGIAVTAYMPLAKGQVADDPVLARIGKRHGVPASTVSLAWILQQGMIAIPASSSRANLEANLKAAAVRLSEAEMSEIATLDRGHRIINPANLSPAWDVPD